MCVLKSHFGNAAAQCLQKLPASLLMAVISETDEAEPTLSQHKFTDVLLIILNN